MTDSGGAEAGGQTTADEASAAAAGDHDLGDTIRHFVDDSYAKVPDIGSGHRWYDYPYRLLHWLLTGWRRRLFPRSLRSRFNGGLNYLTPFNQHDRHKAWDRADPLHNITVPADEHVTMPSLWVVELFPPSELQSLKRAIKKHDWDRQRRLYHPTDSNRDQLTQSRGGSGWAWWRLADITAPNSQWLLPDRTIESLPSQFAAVSLKAMQTGQGLTAIAAQFWLTGDSARALDEVWHADHEPQLIRRWRRRPRAEDRQWTTFRLTQEARADLHRVARSWMRKTTPGFFASSGEPHPLLDMLLMDISDPLAGDSHTKETSDIFRALGLTEYHPLVRTSPTVPNLVLVPTQLGLTAGIKTDRTWAVWGQRDAAFSAAQYMDGYDRDPTRALAARYSDELQGLLLTMAITELIRCAEQQYAHLRDSARVRHGKFRSRALQDLRQHLLTLSLDISSIHQDLRPYWRRTSGYIEQAVFFEQFNAHIQAEDKAAGRPTHEPVNLDLRMRAFQRTHFARLVEADKEFREILSTAASLGASAEASRLSRRALWVSFVSLCVAAVTLLVTDHGDDSVLQRLLDWLK